MLLLLASYRPKNPMRSGSLVGLRPKPWWRGPVTPGNPAAHPDDPAVDGGTDGVVHLTVELWEGVSVDDGGLLKITKGGRVHNVTDDVPGHRRGRVVRLRVRNREVGQSMIAREKPHERRKEGPRDEGARERVAPGGAGSRRFARELEPPPPPPPPSVTKRFREARGRVPLTTPAPRPPPHTLSSPPPRPLSAPPCDPTNTKDSRVLPLHGLVLWDEAARRLAPDAPDVSSGPSGLVPSGVPSLLHHRCCLGSTFNEAALAPLVRLALAIGFPRGEKPRRRLGGSRLLGEDFRVQIPHRPRLFQSPPPQRPGGSTRGNPDRKTRNLHARDPEFLFFLVSRRGGGPEVHRAGARDGPKHTLRRHDGGREDQVRRRRERRARERESVLRRRGIGREVGCGHAGAATLVRVPVTPETSREQPAPAWPRHRRVWRAAFLVPFGRRLRQ